MSAAADPLELAAPLLATADRPPAVSVERLAGGKNNRVFALALADGTDLVLKCYFRDLRDRRDRLATETRFLRYAKARGVDAVPVLLACDEAAGTALMTRLPGAKLRAGSIRPHHVAAAADFIIALNPRDRDREELAPASEACFSLADHLAAVERRLARLESLDPEAPYHDEARELVREVLAPAWHAVAGEVQRYSARSGIALEAALDPAERIVSPSDFGFHNVLAAGGRLGFLDFEYAGCDDPAKLVGDFYNAPEVPTPPSTFDAFVERIARSLGIGEGFVVRASALLDLYRVKWACIILNDFLPQDAARRGFALAGDRAERCRTQLEKARGKLDEIATPLPIRDPAHGLS